MTAADRGAGDVERAVRLATIFHPQPGRFAHFRAVSGEALPRHFRELLDHASHMTVVMERFYGGPVGVVVVAEHAAGGGPEDREAWYEREILLRSAAGRIVQHGIVRIDLACTPPAVAAEIRAGRTPLGRVLIAAGMLLKVHCVGLLAVDPGPELQGLLGADDAETGAAPQAFGRVAEIAVSGVPAVELLEIVAPGPLPKVLP
ncbi:hypothetical protein EBR56_07255 [bacterium]|nr:hypothetical protein [bacterium]